MFICKTCLTEKYANHPSAHLFRSHGKCECCGFTKDCHDIPSKNLIPKAVPQAKKKILIIGQAPPAVPQQVPYDTTMLYDILRWAGVTKQQAQEMFVFEACTDRFLGHGDEGHKVPTREHFDEHYNKALKSKLADADKVWILGAVAFNHLMDHPKANIEMCFKHVLSTIHPSKRNYSRIMQDRDKLTEKLKAFLAL